MKKLLVLLLSLVIVFTFAACGGSENSENSSNATDSRNEEILLDNPITIVDNDDCKIDVVKFFREVSNEGTENEFVTAGVVVEAENKNSDYKIDVTLENCSLEDNRTFVFADYGGNSIVMPGTIGTIIFTKHDSIGDDTDFENLEDLYNLKGYVNIRFSDENYSYADLKQNHQFNLADK